MIRSLPWIMIFGSLVKRFANDFHSLLRHSQKLLASHLTDDPKIVIHGNACIILYISIANALEVLQSCTKPSILYAIKMLIFFQFKSIYSILEIHWYVEYVVLFYDWYVTCMEMHDILPKSCGACQYKDSVLPTFRIPILNIIQSWDHVIFIMGINV